ncbi:MAG: Dabb family protein [Anaerolineae bacterium]
MPYQRIVCFKFIAEATPEQVQAHMDDFAALRDAVPGITEYRAGPVMPEGVEPKYDSLHYLVFAREEDIQRYFNHRAHQQFIQRNRPIWEDVLVLNAPIE